MLNNLLFSLDRVMPYFLLIILGAVLRKTKLVPRHFFEEANRFTVRVALPVLLFCNIVDIDWNVSGRGGFMLYVLVMTLVSFAAIWIVTELIYKDKAIVGTLVQGAFRGNFILIGMPIVGSVLGPEATKTAALASVVIVPVYNILAVVILTVRGKVRQSYGAILKGIVTNPLIIGITCGAPFMLLGIKLPSMLGQTAVFVGQCAPPLGLLSIGGLLNAADAYARLKPAIYAASIKNFLLPLIVVPISFMLGYRGDELLSLFVITAAPVAVSSYAMASQMGGDAPLASNIMILTTLFSGIALAVGIYILKTLALI